jgi:hypothetical protein
VPEDKRTEAWGFMKRAAAEGWSANETLSMLQEQGLGYRRSDFLSDFREFAKIPQARTGVKYTPKDKSVSDRNIIVTPENLSSDFKVIIHAEVTDIATGKKTIRLFTHSTNVKKTVGEWEEDFRGDFAADYEEAGLEIGKVYVQDVYRKP